MNSSHEIQVEKARPEGHFDDPDNKAEISHDDAAVDLKAQGNKDSAGLAVIEQFHTIPTTGARKVTTKWEYWTYCAFCEFYIQSQPTSISADMQTWVPTEIVCRLPQTVSVIS